MARMTSNGQLVAIWPVRPKMTSLDGQCLILLSKSGILVIHDFFAKNRINTFYYLNYTLLIINCWLFSCFYFLKPVKMRFWHKKINNFYLENFFWWKSRFKAKKDCRYTLFRGNYHSYVSFLSKNGYNNKISKEIAKIWKRNKQQQI